MSDEWAITMPKLGETVTEGTIGSWRKQVGDTVEFDDPLFEVSTDKVDSELPSPGDGGRARDRRPQRPDALAAGTAPRGGVRARRRRDHRFRRGRPDPA